MTTSLLAFTVAQAACHDPAAGGACGSLAPPLGDGARQLLGQASGAGPGWVSHQPKSALHLAVREGQPGLCPAVL